MKRQSCFKKTDEDWYPNFYGELVRVTYEFIPDDEDPRWLVCVWGNDDCGMECFFKHQGRALEVFWNILEQDVIRRDFLCHLGLHSA